jgi:hypothetical protein
MRYRELALGFLLLGGVLAVALQIKYGVLFFVLSAVCAFYTRERAFFVSFLSILVSTTILAFTPINTDTGNVHVLLMTLGCGAALVLPHIVAWRMRAPIQYQWWSSSVLTWPPLVYLAAVGVLGYFLIPWYFNVFPTVPMQWPMPATYSTESTMRLFIGTNLLGIWDEFFFISTVFVLLLRFFHFRIAMVAQAVLFTSFLYELGFIAIGPLLIFPFALLQAYAFKRTHSLVYVIVLHLTLDAILFLTIMHAHYPGYAPFFLS